MGYWNAIGVVVGDHQEEVQADLEEARQQLRRARVEVAQLESTVAALERLLELAGQTTTSVADSTTPMTLHEAMHAVLMKSPGHRLRAGDLASEINRRGLYRMRDGRPVEAQQIHARVGHYPRLLTKEGTFIKAVDA